jgi:hypothetical protein
LTKASIWSRNLRFCWLVTDGRSSKVTRATMSFSLKLPVSTRATANESPGSSLARMALMMAWALSSSLV